MFQFFKDYVEGVAWRVAKRNSLRTINRTLGQLQAMLAEEDKDPLVIKTPSQRLFLHSVMSMVNSAETSIEAMTEKSTSPGACGPARS